MTDHTKERPILFSAPMVRAILEGRKTQTRRVAKGVVAVHSRTGEAMADIDSNGPRVACPYGHLGDRLWVRETWRHIDGGAVYDAAGGIMDSHDPETIYRASRPSYPGPWKPSIYMPRWASRILLEVVSVRVERLNEISPSDALSEGVFCPEFGYAQNGERAPVGLFAGLWEDINGPGSWEANPWVWVVEFKMVTR